MPVLGASGGASFYGGTTTATASGAIADGDPVVLNADGTVSSVTQQGLEAGNAGSRFFVSGNASGSFIHQYSVSTDYDVSTASYSGVSFSIGSEEVAPNGLFFDPSGYKMYILGYDSDAVHQYALGASYDVNSASYTGNSFSIASQDSAPRDLVFNPDGTKMFVVGSASDSVFLYNLSTGFDISTASYSGTSFSVASQSTVPLSLEFSPDGTKMYILEYSGRTVYQYTLTTGFDITTASYASKSFFVGSQEVTPIGLDFNADGTKMYVVGSTNDTVFEYDLSTAFDVSTASYSTRSFSVAAQEGTPFTIKFCGTIYKSNLSSADKYLGISDGAYADGATATIQLVGSIDDAQSGLTPGRTHYLQNDGSFSTMPGRPQVEGGYAISATELLIKGGYSTVTATPYAPTPLADCVPSQYGVGSTRVYMYQNATQYGANTANFWTGLDYQGAYRVITGATDFTEVVSVTGSGILGTIIIGAFTTPQNSIIEVTIDGEVREWDIKHISSFRAVLSFSPLNLLERSNVNHVTTATNSVSNFDANYTTPYSTMYTDYGTTTDNVYVQPATITGGLRFKNYMRVRIKSAASYYDNAYRAHHGVLYAVYN